MGVQSGNYPSLATTWDSNADLWIAYEKDVNGTSRAIYTRFLDYPSAGWQAPETVDSVAGSVFTRPSIGVDKDNGVHALYVSTPIEDRNSTRLNFSHVRISYGLFCL